MKISDNMKLTGIFTAAGVVLGAMAFGQHQHETVDLPALNKCVWTEMSKQDTLPNFVGMDTFQCDTSDNEKLADVDITKAQYTNSGMFCVSYTAETTSEASLPAAKRTNTACITLNDEQKSQKDLTSIFARGSDNGLDASEFKTDSAEPKMIYVPRSAPIQLDR